MLQTKYKRLAKKTNGTHGAPDAPDAYQKFRGFMAGDGCVGCDVRFDKRSGILAGD